MKSTIRVHANKHFQTLDFNRLLLNTTYYCFYNKKECNHAFGKVIVHSYEVKANLQYFWYSLVEAGTKNVERVKDIVFIF